jgi:hypothetical protein
MQPGTPGGRTEKSEVSLASGKLTGGYLIQPDLSHTGRTIHLVFPKIERKTARISAPKLIGIRRERKKVTHYDTKIDLRVSHETSEEVDKIANFNRRSKSEILRQFVESGVKSTRKDPAYRRYLRKLLTEGNREN